MPYYLNLPDQNQSFFLNTTSGIQIYSFFFLKKGDETEHFNDIGMHLERKTNHQFCNKRNFTHPLIKVKYGN